MNLSVLIVFYNASPSESATLQSILAAELSSLQGIHITLWNNGSELFDNETITLLQKDFASKNITGTLYNTTHNFTLSSIYNFFIAQGNYTHYIIFDHDSSFAPDFFSKLNSKAQYNIVLPAIFEISTREPIGPASRDKPHAPFYELAGERAYSGRPVTSIGSGICISKSFIQKFSPYYGSVFNEAFSLYAVDTCFFEYVSDFLKNHPDYPFYITNTIDHSLSKFLDEGLPMQKFKRLESAHAHTLLRLHTKKKSRRKALSYILRQCVPSCSSFRDFFSLCKIVITKRHPRVTQQQNSFFAQTIKKPQALPPQ